MASEDAHSKLSAEKTSSLEILDPAPTSSSPPSATSRRKTRTEVYLEELGTAICHCVSTQNWNHWAVGHITEDFEAYIEHADTPFVRNVEEYKQAYNSIAERYPGYRNELVDINAEVDERAGTAALWILLRIHHHPTQTMKGRHACTVRPRTQCHGQC